MRHMLFGLAMVVATAMLAQPQGQPPPNSPPYRTPPTFPQGQQTQGQMPPDQNAPPRGLSNHEAAQQIQQGLKSDPVLRDSNVAVHVDKKSVVLAGTIQNDDQHDRALRIARSYAGDRQVIDKLKQKQGS